MNRTPPIAVRRALAAEVGFGCPVDGCGSPYLTWHHFDPPWATEQHHNAEGMIALCRDHHPEADGGAFTTKQLHEMKAAGRDRNLPLLGQFHWRRTQLVAVVGGSFYVDVPTPIQIQQTPVVSFTRDEDGHLLLNINQPSLSGQPRMRMIENFWITAGSDESEITCPPSGKRLRAKYPNGDEIAVEFLEIDSLDAFDKRYPRPGLPPELIDEFKAHGIVPPERVNRSHAESIQMAGLTFPLTVVEITMEVAGSPLSFGPTGTTFGNGSVTGSWMVRCGVGIQLN